MQQLALPGAEWDQMEQPAPAIDIWKPVEGEFVIGTIESYQTGTGRFGKCPVITLRRKNGQRVRIWVFHTVLQDHLKQQNARVGELVRIDYLGKRVGKTFTYHNYSLQIKRNQAPALSA
jgi:hypothetical protein